MPLSSFGVPKADLNIQIDSGTIHPGDAFEARVELVPREDFHVRLGRVELVCVETCVQITRSQYGTHYSKKTHNWSHRERNYHGRQDRPQMGQYLDRRQVRPAAGRAAHAERYYCTENRARHRMGSHRISRRDQGEGHAPAAGIHRCQAVSATRLAASPSRICVQAQPVRSCSFAVP